MKLSLRPLAVATAMFALFAAAGCGTTDDAAAPAPKPADETPATETPPAPKRTLVDGRQLPASPVNLLVDPGFGLAGQQASYGAFLAFLEADYSAVTLGATLDSRSPAAFGGAVGIVKPDGATNKSSNPVLVLASFPGGDGPFHGKVWISKSDVNGRPIDFGTDVKSIRASITDASPDGDAFDLKPTQGATKTIGGRTWVLLEADVPKPLVFGGYFVIHTGGAGGQWHLAAPEVLAKPLVDGLSTRSLSVAAPAGAPDRAKTAAERRAIARYASMPPRWIPAQKKVSPR